MKILKNEKIESEILSNYIKENFHNCSTKLQILEAGCGRQWAIDLSGLHFELTGIDINQKSLEIRKTKYNDLDTIIIGDLQTVDLEHNKYEVIYNSYVLEHIKNAEKVLNNFFSWLKSDGVLILKIPDGKSVYGFITRITPFKFHIFVRRHIFRKKNAGKPGYGPFPTYYSNIISRDGIRKYCQNKNHTVIAEYGINYYISSLNFFNKVFVTFFVKLISVLSLGRLCSSHNALIYIIKKSTVI